MGTSWSKDEKVQNFLEVTKSTKQLALEYLAGSDWNVPLAITQYFEIGENTQKSSFQTENNQNQLQTLKNGQNNANNNQTQNLPSNNQLIQNQTPQNDQKQIISIISQFIASTNANFSDSERFLEQNAFKIEEALKNYYEINGQSEETENQMLKNEDLELKFELKLKYTEIFAKYSQNAAEIMRREKYNLFYVLKILNKNKNHINDKQNENNTQNDQHKENTNNIVLVDKENKGFFGPKRQFVEQKYQNKYLCPEQIKNIEVKELTQHPKSPHEQQKQSENITQTKPQQQEPQTTKVLSNTTNLQNINTQKFQKNEYEDDSYEEEQYEESEEEYQNTQPQFKLITFNVQNGQEVLNQLFKTLGTSIFLLQKPLVENLQQYQQRVTIKIDINYVQSVEFTLNNIILNLKQYQQQQQNAQMQFKPVYNQNYTPQHLPSNNFTPNIISPRVYQSSPHQPVNFTPLQPIIPYIQEQYKIEQEHFIPSSFAPFNSRQSSQLKNTQQTPFTRQKKITVLLNNMNLRPEQYTSLQVYIMKQFKNKVHVLQNRNIEIICSEHQSYNVVRVVTEISACDQKLQIMSEDVQ
ncbi:UBA-like_superfamily [Hexamita inflata]|uniref:UBA-like superfamily n=1 Tax=Hexamita inflata TaxID=28002 RepID=A0AA86R001_9EUKA|nr:UBA-like superfamily [Hexamita inflata]